MKFRTLLAAALLSAFAVPGYAQWYVGGAVGQSRAHSLDGGDRSSQFLGLGFDSASTSVDKTDSAYRVFGGYRMHRYVAVELGVDDFGRYQVTSDVQPEGTFRSSARVSGVDASVLGLLPIGERFTLFARGGVISARTRVSYDSSGSVRTNEGVDSRQRNSGALYGAGAMMQVAPRWNVRLDWTKYRRIGDDTLSSRFDVSAWLVGVAYRF